MNKSDEQKLSDILICLTVSSTFNWFKILGGYNLKDYRLVIYNRWEQKVFETVDFAKGWNGSFNGQMLSSATFVWYCEIIKPGNASKTKIKGTVTLIRLKSVKEN